MLGKERFKFDHFTRMIKPLHSHFDYEIITYRTEASGRLAGLWRLGRYRISSHSFLNVLEFKVSLEDFLGINTFHFLAHTLQPLRGKS